MAGAVQDRSWPHAILSGGVSSIFISAPIAALWKEREPNEVKAAARRARKAARVATVDSDIMDVSAFNRADAALAAVSEPAGDNGAILDEIVEVDSSNGRPAEPEPLEVGDNADDGAFPPTGDATSAPPPQKPRRHQTARRKRRR